jgi:hypothetical protein
VLVCVDETSVNISLHAYCYISFGNYRYIPLKAIECNANHY